MSFTAVPFTSSPKPRLAAGPSLVNRCACSTSGNGETSSPPHPGAWLTLRRRVVTVIPRSSWIGVFRKRATTWRTAKCGRGHCRCIDRAGRLRMKVPIRAMVISCAVSTPATIAVLMAICERRNDRPAALARSEAEDGGLSDLVASRGMPPLGGRGRRSRTSHCG